MTWHEVTVAADELALLLVGISVGGGTITNSRPCPGGVAVTYVTHQP